MTTAPTPASTLQHHFAVVATQHPDGTVTWGIDVEFPGFDEPIWDEAAEEWRPVGAAAEDHLALLDQLGSILAATSAAR